MWVIAKALLGGAWSFLRALPWWLYVAVIVLFVGWRWHDNAVDAAREAGDNAARRELTLPIVQAHALAAAHLSMASAYYAQASQAEGKALAFSDGLNSCIGTRTALDVITSAVLRGREQQRVAATRALTATQQELSHAYASASDRCADYPVPDAVVRVLDIAAFGAPGTAGSDADSGDPGPAVRAHTYLVDGADAGTGTTGTTYRDLADWIASGWAAALSSCNADKASIGALGARAPSTAQQ
jgi:hypothetical protein